MHFIGFGNVDFSAFHHFISSNKILILTVRLQILMCHGKLSIFNRSGLFIIYASVTVAPENIITGCTRILSPGNDNAVLLCLARCKKYRKFQTINVLPAQFGLIGLLDREDTFPESNPVIWIRTGSLGNCDRIDSHLFTVFSFYCDS